MHVIRSIDVDDLMAASRPDPDKPDDIWETGKDLSILHLDHIPEDAPQHADLGRYSKHLSGSLKEKGVRKQSMVVACRMYQPAHQPVALLEKQLTDNPCPQSLLMPAEAST